VASDISQELRAEVARRTDWRCEYCLIREEDAGFPHQVDHIVSRKHGGLSSADNLAYACVLCNRQKGTDLHPLTRALGRLSGFSIHGVIAGPIIFASAESLLNH